MNKKIRLAMLALLIAPSFSFAIGAIAVDDEEGLKADEVGYYYVTGEDSEAAAKKEALKGCKKEGNKNCKIAGWFKNCGAYVVSKKYSGYGYGKTKQAAIDMAMEECGNNACKVAVAQCE